MRNNFIIVKNLEELDRLINNISNFPKKEVVLKKEIIKIIRDIYINIYIMVYDYNKDLGIEIISLINYLNELIDRLYNKKIINKTKYLNIGNLVIEITKLLRGYFNEKNK